MTAKEATTCSDCGKTRTIEPDYSPIQPIMGKPMGWYSDSDTELCPDCIVKMMSTAQPQFASQYTPWREGMPV